MRFTKSRIGLCPEQRVGIKPSQHCASEMRGEANEPGIQRNTSLSSDIIPDSNFFFFEITGLKITTGTIFKGTLYINPHPRAETHTRAHAHYPRRVQ